MNSNEPKATIRSRKGLSFMGLLTVGLILLKASGVVSWGWICVLYPFLISLSVFVLFLIFMGAVFYSHERDRINAKYKNK